MIEKLDSSLTLDDKMYLAIHEYKRTIGLLMVLAGGGILFTAYALLLVFTVDSYLSELDFDFLPIDSPVADSFTVLDYTLTAIGALIITLIFLIGFGAWYGLRAVKFSRELSDMQKQKIRQSYFLAFETTVPQGNTTVERVFDVLSNALPEIKLAQKEAKEKGKKFQYDYEYKIKDTVFDLKVNTPEGIILVEFFKNKLTFDRLEVFVKSIDHAFKNAGILRAVCVAKDFDDIFFSDELEQKLSKLYMPYKMDLVKEDKSGFSTIWID